MIAFNNINNELVFIYGLVALVIVLIIIIIVLDRMDKKKERQNRNRLSDTLQMKPITEEDINTDDYIDDNKNVKSINEVKINLDNIPDYKEDDLEKTQAQIRVEEITNALKDAGVDKEEVYDKYDSFEQEQEKNAIISYEELMSSYDKLYEENEKNQYKDDDTIPINITELYELGEQEKKYESIDNNIESLETDNKTNNSFKNSPYISPVYGIQKNNEADTDNEMTNANEFLSSLKELKSNLE